MPLDPARTALLAIDVQNDFCPAYRHGGTDVPAGALAVPDGHAVVPPLNALAVAFAERGAPVVATQDWHPAGHFSFASSHPEGSGPKPEGVLWPDHCVRGTPGAEFHAGFDLRPVNLILRKGFRPRLDSYSAFFENDRSTPTGLEGWLRRLGIDTVAIGGLATDYCVFYSVTDALRLGFSVLVIEDAVRGVGFPEGSVPRATKAMADAGAGFLPSADLLREFR